MNYLTNVLRSLRFIIYIIAALSIGIFVKFGDSFTRTGNNILLFDTPFTNNTAGLILTFVFIVIGLITIYSICRDKRKLNIFGIITILLLHIVSMIYLIFNFNSSNTDYLVKEIVDTQAINYVLMFSLLVVIFLRLIVKKKPNVLKEEELELR